MIIPNRKKNALILNSFKNTTIFVVMVFFLIGCGSRLDIKNLDSEGETIVCFGDSITQGVGVGPNGNYPAILSEKLGRSVINAGISGETTRDALRRLDRDVLAKNPQLVIVEFGANDFFQKIPREETFENMGRIVTAIQGQGAMVAIAAVKVGLMTDAYFKGFKRIARQQKALLVPDILNGILSEPKLKVDGLHPNEQGYEIVAERIYNAVKILLIR